MRLLFVLLSTLLVTGSLCGQTVNVLDAKGDPGTIIIVRAETDCASLQWVVLDTGLSMIPPELLKDSKTVVVMAGKPGKYRLLVYGALKDVASKPAICTVTVGDPAPVPPPTPPTPTDPLTIALQAAYTLDKDVDRAASLAYLMIAYRTMAAQAPTKKTIKTNADASAWEVSIIQAGDGAGLNQTQVINLRKAIAVDKVAVFGTSPSAPMDLSKLGAEFARIADALGGIK